MKLHYSQTYPCRYKHSLQFYNLMKLHYSQTVFSSILAITNVLQPYEITLFSNGYDANTGLDKVLQPYEITLFSNSQRQVAQRHSFYNLMKLHYSQTNITAWSP